ncbi:iron-siderophore ABC transporter substrate-binding protein [Ferrimonas balearica]|uniref:iron-siderophore ABC transporter substrate-binding protein n=1 Tax=Ferrimonas balearica TaxID=44012 RepID=UPI001F3EC148|nr:iron-siderophore ABC transporter substrate-binding protein [Ferrimonas balearica]MBY6019588.1 iron-siderophore ABC transporter substrate-binding protein [Halomonas denitrificans]MBY6096654.1 iron-siderophore ABC transporter substrate-binding protein [Ferrimonas balearica]
MLRILSLLLLLCPLWLSAEAPCRTVGHLGGESCVPHQPQRIVALGAAEIDSLVALGVTPAGIGSFSGRDFEGFDYLEGELKESAIVGRFTRPNLEAILALEPDLILLSRQVPGNYPLLSRIAPTVVLPDAGGEWRAQLRQMAAVVGQAPEAERYIAEQEQQLAEARQRLQAAGVGSVAFVRFTAKEYRLYGDNRIAGPWLYRDLGLPMPQLVQARAIDQNFVSLSLEELPRLDASVMVLLDQSGRHPLLDSDWLKPIPAVAGNRVLTARRDLWINPAPLAAARATTELTRSLLELYR